jgi:hypothetical protein
MIVQYNTPDGFYADISPYPKNISWQSKSKKMQKSDFLAPNHPVMTTQIKSPLKILKVGPKNKVYIIQTTWQGLYSYFISSNDKGESPTNGAYWLRLMEKDTIFIPV